MSYAVKNLSHGRELIAFRIGDQEFFENIMSVREILGWTTETPETPKVTGGSLAEPTVRHVIIVAQVNTKVVGLLVDAVSDILTVTDENIQPTPDIADAAEKNYARGILAIEGRMICLIELDALFPHTESEAA